MATDPTEQMRYHILEMDTYNLAEQAGMFCDAMNDILSSSGRMFPGSEFTFAYDEPYEVYFEWFFGDVKAGLTFTADRDDSEWFVNSGENMRRRMRMRIGDDTPCSTERLVDEVFSALDTCGN